MKCIKPTDWGTLKTDAIDFGEEFYWLDDYPFQAELNVLKDLLEKALVENKWVIHFGL